MVQSAYELIIASILIQVSGQNKHKLTSEGKLKEREQLTEICIHVIAQSVFKPR